MAEQRRVRILLADDQILFVESLKYVLEGIAPDFQVVGIAKNGLEAVELAASLRPEIILMDVRMPEMDGVEATKAIHLEYPDIRIVMLTTFCDDEYVYFAMKHGASGYLLKNLPPEDLVATVRAVRHGTKLLAPAVTDRMTERMSGVAGGKDGVVKGKTGGIAATRSGGTGEWLSGGIEDGVTGPVDTEAIFRLLSRREKEVLNLVMQMMSNRQIAEKLGIAEQSVRNYTSSIYGKFEIDDRMELIRTLRRHWSYLSSGEV